MFLKRPEQAEVKGKMCCLPKIYKVNFQRTTKISSFEDAFILRCLISFFLSTSFRGLGKLEHAYGIRIIKAVVSEKLWIVISKLLTCVVKFFFSMRRGSQDCAEILQEN